MSTLRWDRGNAKSEEDYTRRLNLAFDIILSYPPEPAPTCARCGAPVEQAETGRPRRYCSDTCRRQADAERSAGQETTVKPTTCARCGEPIGQRTTGRPRKYCGDACRTAR